MIDWIFYGILATIWGSSFLLIKIGLTGFEPATLVAVRVCVASAFLFTFCLLRGYRFRKSLHFWMVGGVLGLFMTAFPFFLIAYGEKTVDSGMASILNATVPLFTMLLVPILHRNDPLDRIQVGGLLLGFVGIAVLMLPGGTAGTRLGMLAVVIGAVCYAIGGIILHRFGRRFDFLPLTAVAALSALLVTSLFAWRVEHPALLSVPARAWVAASCLGLFGTGIAYALFVRLSRNWGPTRSSTITYAIPVVGVLLGVTLGGEVLSWSTVGGGVLIVAGVVGANRRTSPRVRPVAPPPIAPAEI
jgi:drug/metabolite transporter (DMT)-like permease